jgi:ABC-type Fe3+/spermidine/putrescine transport system ATPase subunit
VEKFTFEGTLVRYEVKLENEDVVTVLKPSLTEKWIDVGEKVTLSFDPEKAFVFAYPEAGLAEETAV